MPKAEILVYGFDKLQTTLILSLFLTYVIL